MPNTIQVTGDDSPFLDEQERIDIGVQAARAAIQGKSMTTVCLECGGPIGEARLKAMPSATLCIECKEFHE